jgi:hypothetical protein
MTNWTITHTPSLGVTVQRDGVIVWHDSEAGSYTAEAWRTVLRDLGEVKMRMYAAEDAHRAVVIPDGASYLGDGVYMIVHPNSITLYTERENGVHMVSLGPWMILQLARMVAPTPGA